VPCGLAISMSVATAAERWELGGREDEGYSEGVSGLLRILGTYSFGHGIMCQGWRGLLAIMQTLLESL